MKTSSRRLPHAASAVVWAIALGAPAIALHLNLVRAAERDTSERVLRQVATSIGSPNADRGEIMKMLAERERQRDDTRYVRVCNRLGMTRDWNKLFSVIARANKEQQTKAARIIAEECGLEPGASLKREQMVLCLRVLQSPPDQKPFPLLGQVEQSLD